VCDLHCVQVAELRGEVFWRMPFKSLCEARQLSRYVVMDVEIITEKDRHHVPGQGPESTKVCYFMIKWCVTSSNLIVVL